MSQNHASSARTDDLGNAFQKVRGWFFAVGIFSACVNILSLTASLYMMQVYDRVLSSRSVSTLVALSLIALLAFCVQWSLEYIRGRILTRIGVAFADELTPRVFGAVARRHLIHSAKGAGGPMPYRDLDSLRSFLASPGPAALFDIPFLPIFLGATFLLHPWLGILTVIGGLVISVPTLYSEFASRVPSFELALLDGKRQSQMEMLRRNAVTIYSMGMERNVVARAIDVSRRQNAAFIEGSDVSGTASAAVRSLRVILQSAVLGLAAYLAVLGEVSAGSIIAASILATRALAPIESAVAHWRGFVSSRTALQHLRELLNAVPAEDKKHALPKAFQSLAADGLCIAPPGSDKLTVDSVTFSIQAGDGLGIIGPTGSGKSSLCRGLVGAWAPIKGNVMLDGARLDQWGESLGNQIGYLPQDVELFDGTIAENIARFRTDIAKGDVVEAAQAAGAHDMILTLPDGYNTRLGDAGISLSGGQRQRVGLARAMFGRPFLLVLDEPNANLDNDGDQALQLAVIAHRQRGGIAILITHRLSGLSCVNNVIVMQNGHIVSGGSREDVLGKMQNATAGKIEPKDAPPQVERAS